jgi:hypothetical protein
MTKEKLDQFVLDIEFLLISAVQGVALGSLATAASDPISNLRFQYWPYILSGFLLILTFWSQAIVHSLSFIKWPLDLGHNFLYFLLGLIEFLAFNHLEDPLRWFIFQLVFVIVASALYWIDFRLIKKVEKDFKTQPQKILYQHIYQEQMKEVKTLVPSGIIFNSLAVFLLWRFPDFFILQGQHLWIVGVQVLLTIYIITISIKSFKTRSRLISDIL